MINLPDDPLTGRRRRRPFSPLSGFAQESSRWTVPGSLALLGVLVLATGVAVGRWMLLGSALSFLAAAGLSHLALRERPGALWFGLASLLAIVAGVVLLARI